MAISKLMSTILKKNAIFKFEEGHTLAFGTAGVQDVIGGSIHIQRHSHAAADQPEGAGFVTAKLELNGRDKYGEAVTASFYSHEAPLLAGLGRSQRRVGSLSELPKAWLEEIFALVDEIPQDFQLTI